jgi:hypothetical protein
MRWRRQHSRGRHHRGFAADGPYVRPGQRAGARRPPADLQHRHEPDHERVFFQRGRGVIEQLLGRLERIRLGRVGLCRIRRIRRLRRLRRLRVGRRDSLLWGRRSFRHGYRYGHPGLEQRRRGSQLSFLSAEPWRLLEPLGGERQRPAAALLPHSAPAPAAVS